MKNNEYFHLGGVLLAITAAVALLLGFFNNLTADVIAATKEENERLSMQSVMPNASSFETIEPENMQQDSIITGISEALDENGQRVGYCFSLSPKGYGGEVSVMVGVNSDLTVNGVSIISHSETPGLGANAANEEWLSQFSGKTAGITVVKSSAQGNQIQAVTSATITSTAVTTAVNSALDMAETLNEEAQQQ